MSSCDSVARPDKDCREIVAEFFISDPSQWWDRRLEKVKVQNKSAVCCSSAVDMITSVDFCSWL
jgi:hypothetical protein